MGDEAMILVVKLSNYDRLQWVQRLILAQEVLARRLYQRCMDCDAQCVEDVFSLFDGQVPECARAGPTDSRKTLGVVCSDLHSKVRNSHNMYNVSILLICLLNLVDTC